jgi:hypothetical protein
VLHVLVLVQVAAGLLAMTGEIILMGGNPVYAVAPVLKPQPCSRLSHSHAGAGGGP